MINIVKYGDKSDNAAISQYMAKVLGDNDFLVDPIAANFRSVHGSSVKHIFAGELSPSIHQCQFTLLNSEIDDTDIDKAMSYYSRIEDKAQYSRVFSEYKNAIQNMGYSELQDAKTAVMFARLSEAHNGKMIWDRKDGLLSQRDIFPETKGLDLLHANIHVARNRVKNLMLFHYAPTLPHETVRNAVNAYKEIKNNVDRFILFAVIPPQQAKKADLIAMTEQPWLEADRNLFMEEVSSVAQEFADSAKILLAMPDTMSTYDMLKLWPLKVKSLTHLDTLMPSDAIFELEKE